VAENFARSVGSRTKSSARTCRAERGLVGAERATRAIGAQSTACRGSRAFLRLCEGDQSDGDVREQWECG